MRSMWSMERANYRANLDTIKAGSGSNNSIFHILAAETRTGDHTSHTSHTSYFPYSIILPKIRKTGAFSCTNSTLTT